MLSYLFHNSDLLFDFDFHTKNIYFLKKPQLACVCLENVAKDLAWEQLIWRLF